MSVLDLHALNALEKDARAGALADTNAQLEALSAEARVSWALENLPGEFVLSSSFGIQAAVCLHLVTQQRPDIPVILTDTGYLFPETYEFLKDDTVHNYVATFYAQFDAQITDEMYAELKKQDMTLPQLITLASFVQEEAGNSQDSNVAQVFRNRLAADSPYPRLQSNTSSHIQSDSDNNYLWNWVAPYYGGWDNIPENIVAAYDTYSCKGLPAGPISNPGIAAIRAALAPQPNEEAKDAYFFVTDLKGSYYYARTLSEHNANCQKAAQVNKTVNTEK